MQAKQYRKKPTVIKASQFILGDPIPEGVCFGVQGGLDCGAGDQPHVHTIHGNQAVKIEGGDFVVPEPDGIHFYPIKPDIFARTYEECGPLYAAKIQRHYAKSFGLTAPSDIGVLVYFDEHKAAMESVSGDRDELLTLLEGVLDEIVTTRRVAHAAMTCNGCGCNVSLAEEHRDDCPVGRAIAGWAFIKAKRDAENGTPVEKIISHEDDVYH